MHNMSLGGGQDMRPPLAAIGEMDVSCIVVLLTTVYCCPFGSSFTELVLYGKAFTGVPSAWSKTLVSLLLPVLCVDRGDPCAALLSATCGRQVQPDAGALGLCLRLRWHCLSALVNLRCHSWGLFWEIVY